jgi:hypothetical protein
MSFPKCFPNLCAADLHGKSNSALATENLIHIKSHHIRQSGKITPPISVNQSHLSNYMSEKAKSQFLKKLQPSQFQRRAVFSNNVALFLKGDVNLRKGKMSLLHYRQGVNASHIRNSFTQIKIMRMKIYK